jgi:formylglycine-generating enzyme required for sulfatase activity
MMAARTRRLAAAWLSLLGLSAILACRAIVGIHDEPPSLLVDGAPPPPSDSDATPSPPDAAPDATAGAGLTTCGADGGEDCRATLRVPGGTYDRSAGAPASVSSFRLDRFEVTVGRFRAFVAAAAAGWRPRDGSGKHAHLGTSGVVNVMPASSVGFPQACPTVSGPGPSSRAPGAYEFGWQTQWNDDLAISMSAWNSALACDSQYQTWTDSPGASESLPIVCETWYEAYAFCIWDGGFLPTEAEWQYAAGGGDEQRYFPWSPSGAPGGPFDCSYANLGGSNFPTSACVNLANRVGSEPKGDGKWGHADLEGNAWEWVLDNYPPWLDYVTPCADCATVDLPNCDGILRGGAFDTPAAGTGDRNKHALATRSADVGVRCARAP